MLRVLSEPYADGLDPRRARGPVRTHSALLEQVVTDLLELEQVGEGLRLVPVGRLSGIGRDEE